MNTQQRNYAAAKAYLETCEAVEAEKESQYIMDNNITNDDGGTPEKLYMIENEAVLIPHWRISPVQNMIYQIRPTKQNAS